MSFQYNIGCGCNKCGTESSVKSRWYSTWRANGGAGNIISIRFFYVCGIYIEHIILFQYTDYEFDSFTT